MIIDFKKGIPYYGKNGCRSGFVGKNSFYPPRSVATEDLYLDGDAVKARENIKVERHPGTMTNFDLGGMIFRIDLEPGAHKISIECTESSRDMLISVAGTNPDKIQSIDFWDAAELIPNCQKASWNGNIWTYCFAHGTPFLEIEIEPYNTAKNVGIRKIQIERIGPRQREIPAIYILGDSTAKSYVFEEAPMSGWGQCFERMTDHEMVRVFNYSNGGRSLRTMYQEGRFNDVLLSGKAGDYVFIQSGHNDERDRNDGEDPDGEEIRFGGGSTEEMYYRLLTDYFIPGIRARGMIPVLVTPVTRIDGSCPDQFSDFSNSFTTRRFPDVMRRAAEDGKTMLLDMNKKSVEHFRSLGGLAAKAVVMAVEPGETPGKTNSGSYANGNPMNHADGTHYKEALSKQYCRMAAEEIYRLYKDEKCQEAASLYALLAADVKLALEKNDFSEVYPEVCKDTVRGDGAYYRNQIEKMVQLGIMKKDSEGKFNPKKQMGKREFAEAIAGLWKLSEDFAKGFGDGVLTRADAAEILYDAYILRFSEDVEKRPKYMTDYNGISIDPSDPNYDANIPIGETIYYPLVLWKELEDVGDIPKNIREKAKRVYELGIMRSESGIERGSLKNGVFFEPYAEVNREKAAKLLYFCFVLEQDVKKENHLR